MPPADGDNARQPTSSTSSLLPPAPPSDRRLTLRLSALDVSIPSTGRLVLGNASLALPPGGRAFIVGPSGVGKSRLLRAVAALDPPPADRSGSASSSPSITLGGRTPEEWGGPAWRARVLYLPPSPGAAAAAAAGGKGGNGGGGATATNLVGGPGGPTPAGLLDAARALAAQRARPGGEATADPAARARLTNAATALLLDPPCLDQAWGTLSSGQQARAALAVCLALAPHVLVLDEPTASLDGAAAAAAERALASCGSSLVWVTHDPDQPRRVGGGRLYRVVPGVGPGGCAGLVDEGEV